VGLARGSFLFVSLTLDLIERGHIVAKSASYKVLPQTLAEIFRLEFNLRFASCSAFRQVRGVAAKVYVDNAVLRIRGVYPGSEFFHPRSRFQGSKDSRTRIRIKEFKNFNPKNCF
jgi:hypothetical protein